jgi:uncharacterized protein (DUF1697 family)
VRYVALVRGINVGGNNRLPMADLSALCQSLGFCEPKTLLQSGNVVFHSDLDASIIEHRLEEATERDLGLKVAYMVRGLGEVQEIVTKNPFHAEALSDPSHLVVVFFKRECPDGVAIDWPGPERFSLADRHLYVYYPEGIGTSKMPANLIEKTFGPCTARNWNTVQKILALPSGDHKI